MTTVSVPPTGSGVAELQIAYEQMKLTQNGNPEGVIVSGRTDAPFVGRDPDDVESEAPPS